MKLPIVVVCLTLMLPFTLRTSALAAELKLVPATSVISFHFSQLGVPMQGKFGKFSARVLFDASKPEATNASFSVDLNSVDLGAADYNVETKKPVWLDALKFPSATFVAEKVTALGGNKFSAQGKLTIKSISQPITAQFSFTDGAKPVVEGSFPMKRLAWKIGDGEWKDTSIVADEVMVKFRFVTSK